MAIDDIGIGIRARVEGSQEGEQLAQTLNKISQSAQQVSTQKPGFERWKEELARMDRSLDQWHAKIEKMRRPFGKEDVKEVEKYHRLAKKTLRDIDAEHKRNYQQKMRRLQEEKRSMRTWGKIQAQEEIDRTEKSRERWEKERDFYRRFIEETEEQQREVMEGGPEQARARGRGGLGILAGPGGLVRGAAMAVGAGLGIAGGMSLFGFLSGSLRTWIELDQVTTRLARKFGKGKGTLEDGVSEIGKAFSYTDKQVSEFMEHYGELAGATDRQRFQTIIGYSRWAGMRPEETMQFGVMQRLGGMDEIGQTRFLQRFSDHLTRYGLQPMRTQMTQTVGQIGQMFLQRVERPSYTAAIMALEAVGRIGGGPEGPAVYQGPEALQFIQGMQQALGPGGTGPGRALRLAAYGYGGGTTYWEAMKREYQGLMRPENLTDVLKEMERRYGGLKEEDRNLMYMRAWQQMGWGNITADMVERMTKFTKEGGLEEYERYMKEQAPKSKKEAEEMSKKWFEERGLPAGFAEAGKGMESFGEKVHRSIYTAQEFIGDKIGHVAKAVTEGIEKSSDKFVGAFKDLAAGDFGAAVTKFTGGVDKFVGVLTGGPGERIKRAEEEAEYGLEQAKRVAEGAGVGALFPGVGRKELGLRIHTMSRESLEEIAGLPGGREILEQVSEEIPWGPLNVLARTLFSPVTEGRPRFMRSTLEHFLEETAPSSVRQELTDGRNIEALDRNTEAVERLAEMIDSAKSESSAVVGPTE